MSSWGPALSTAIVSWQLTSGKEDEEEEGQEEEQEEEEKEEEKEDKTNLTTLTWQVGNKMVLH